MPSIYLTLAVNFGLYAVCIYFYFTRKNVIYLGCSTTWFFIIIVEIFVLNQNLHTPIGTDQLIGSTLIMASITAADIFISNKQFAGGEDQPLLKLSVGLTFAVVTIGLIALHIFKANTLPITLFFQTFEYDNAVAEARKDFTKNLDVSFLFKTAFNWIFVVFFPIVSYLLVKSKRYYLLAFFFFIVLNYSILSTANLPFFISVILISFLVLSKQKAFYQKIAMAIFVVSMSAATVLSVMRADDFENYKKSVLGTPVGLEIRKFQQLEIDGGPRFSPTDVRLVRGSQPPASAGRQLDYLIRRVFLIPTDVAMRWYNYYGHIAEKPRGLDEFNPSTRSKPEFEHASNLVGKWAYYERFPEQYTNYVHAYTSADADAFSFGGLKSVALVALLIFLIRAVPLAFIKTELAHVSYTILQVACAFFLFQASIQALLISQGIFLILLLIGVFYLADMFRTKNQSNSI